LRAPIAAARRWHASCDPIQCKTRTECAAEKTMTPTTIAVAATEAFAELYAQLAGEGHVVVQHASMAALLRELRTGDPDVLLIDARSADIDWRTVVKREHSWRNTVLPVVLLGECDPGPIEALAAGADDFISVNAVGGELRARVLAAIARRKRLSSGAGGLRCGGVILQLPASSISGAHGAETLTARELALARMLFDNIGHVVSRRRLAHHIWGCEEELASRSIDQHMYQLRRKLRRCARDQLALRGVYGAGYRLDALAAEQSSCSRG
jgi:DNA-binding response OmpR family regulator